ncbi:hypothetical protein OC844_001426 [Tilletia horrida]|nr:hypothetical protein OC844_001426 [Tilletia horrida]
MKAFRLTTFATAVPLLAALSVLPPAQALPFPGWFSSLLQPRATVCNGFAELCSRSFANFTVIGTHDSYAISPTNLAANQDVSVTAQLDAGIRMLQVQAHKSDNRTVRGAGIDLCHTSCSLFQGGSLEYYLSQVKSWMDKNPTEVLSLLIVNSDSLPASQFAQAFESTGLAPKSYRPPAGIAGTAKTEWPTLGALIDAGTPLVSFLASYADSSVPYLLDEFSSIWEPRYNQLTTPFNCSVDRIVQGYDASNLMYLANFFKDQSVFGSTTLVIPDKKAMSTTNSMASILSNANNCASQHNSYPTFILTDFFNTPHQNGPLSAAAVMNGMPWTSNSTGVPFGSITYSGYSASQYGSGSSSGNSSSSGNGAGAGTGNSGGGGGSSAAAPSLHALSRLASILAASTLLAVALLS